MAQITAPKDLAISDPQGFLRAASYLFRQIVEALTGRLTFGENVQGQAIEVNFESANVDKQISHTLGYTPTGYLVFHSSVAMSIYGAPDGRWNAGQVFLKSNAAGVAKIFLF